ncbi:RcnB family protein [Phenylobacterium sp.]|uniref:RcnB family protein n=1 Tax=Phenylobacterium sp. TaxID=1871053 RepID=UPI002FCA3443
MKRLILFAAAAALLTAPAALADPGQGKGHGKDKHYNSGPPGLSDKPYGMPPGQAKKMWRQGERLPRAYYVETRYVIVQPQRYRLAPPPPGYRWVLIEGDAYLVRRDNGLVAEVIANAIANLIR